MKFLNILLVAALATIVTARSVEFETNISENDQAELKGFITSLISDINSFIIQLIKDIWNDLIADPINTFVEPLAAIAAHFFAGISIGIGKRSIDDKGFWDLIWDTIVQSFIDLINELVSTTALTLTQILACISSSSISNWGKCFEVKREITVDPSRGFWDLIWDTIVQSFIDLINELVSTTALTLTQILACISSSSISNWGKCFEVNTAARWEKIIQIPQVKIIIDYFQANPLSIEQLRGFWDQIWDTIVQSFIDLINELVSTTALTLTQILACISSSSISNWGKCFEVERNFFSNIISALLQTITFQIAVWLNNIATNGLLPTWPKEVIKAIFQLNTLIIEAVQA